MAQMLYVPWVGNVGTVPLLEAVGSWPNDLRHNEWSLPRGRELVDARGILNMLEHQVSNVEGALSNVAFVVTTDLLLMPSVSE